MNFIEAPYCLLIYEEDAKELGRAYRVNGCGNDVDEQSLTMSNNGSLTIRGTAAHQNTRVERLDFTILQPALYNIGDNGF